MVKKILFVIIVTAFLVMIAGLGMKAFARDRDDRHRPPRDEEIKCYEHRTATPATLACADGLTENTDTGMCHEWIESSETQTANAICPNHYHYQNDGSWSQRCHRDSNWHSGSEHLSPSCPGGYSVVNNVCSRTVDTSHWSDDVAKIEVTSESWSEWTPGRCEDESRCESRQTECPVITPEPTPEITPEPQHGGSGVSDGRAPQATAPQCTDGTTTKLPANVHVIRVPNSTTANVRWIQTEGDGANVYFQESDAKGWKHADRDIHVTGGFGNVIIGELHTDREYIFGVQQKNGCGGGPIVLAREI